MTAPSIRRILLVKTSSLGDVVHNLPVVSDIARHLPEAHIDWLVEEAFAELPRLHPAIERVIPVAVRRWRRAPLADTTRQEFAALRALLHEQAYDLVLDSQGLLKSALLGVLAQLTLKGQRCGYAFSSAREHLAALFYHRRLAIPWAQHAIERNRQLAAAALALPAPMALDYGICASPLGADWLAAPYAVLLSATSRADKQWPAEHWRSLAQWLNALGLHCVFPGGSVAERALAAELAQGCPHGIAAPALALEAMARLLAGAHLVVGVDTGLMHLAAALGRPTLALFVASDPQLTGVVGRRVANLGRRGQPPSVTEVIDQCRALLRDG